MFFSFILRLYVVQRAPHRNAFYYHAELFRAAPEILRAENLSKLFSS